MKFSIGDLVLLKRTGEEGRVTAFINQKLLEVEVDGTTFPVHLEDIDHPYLKWFTEKAPQKKKSNFTVPLPPEPVTVRQQRLAKGVYLSFMPVYKTVEMEEEVDVLKVFLLNELPVSVKFVYDVRLLHKSMFRHEGVLHGFGNIYLHSVSYTDMNDQPRFHWRLADHTNPLLAEAEGILRLKPAKLFEQVSGLQQSGNPSFTYLLLDDFRPVPPKEPKPDLRPVAPAVPVAGITRHNIEAARYEIDLHIEQLVEHKRGMTNTEIVLLQLNTLKHYLQLAIVHRQERMIVIHGLGKGKLREEVHAILKQTPEVARFKNEWSGKYGFGATEVIFRF